MAKAPTQSLIETASRSGTRRQPAPTSAWGEVTIGKLMAFDDESRPLVDFPGNPVRWPLPARSTEVLAEAEVGREVALLFESGEPSRPLVVGVLRTAADLQPAPPSEVRIDGERLVLDGEREIVLRCGEASITLTRAGKILLRGKYLLNQSDGVNRILGGSVEIN